MAVPHAVFDQTVHGCCTDHGGCQNVCKSSVSSENAELQMPDVTKINGANCESPPPTWMWVSLNVWLHWLCKKNSSKVWTEDLILQDPIVRLNYWKSVLKVKLANPYKAFCVAQSLNLSRMKLTFNSKSAEIFPALLPAGNCLQIAVSEKSIIRRPLTSGLSLILLQRLAGRHLSISWIKAAALWWIQSSFRFQPEFKKNSLRLLILNSLLPEEIVHFSFSWVKHFLSQTLHFLSSFTSLLQIHHTSVAWTGKKIKWNIDANTSSLFVAVAAQTWWHYTGPFIRGSSVTSPCQWGLPSEIRVFEGAGMGASVQGSFTKKLYLLKEHWTMFKNFEIAPRSSKSEMNEGVGGYQKLNRKDECLWQLKSTN